MMGLSDSERISMIRSAVLIQYTRVTDGRTELAWHIRAIAHMLSRVKTGNTTYHYVQLYCFHCMHNVVCCGLVQVLLSGKHAYLTKTSASTDRTDLTNVTFYQLVLGVG